MSQRTWANFECIFKLKIPNYFEYTPHYGDKAYTISALKYNDKNR